MAKKVGLSCKLYRNTGTYAAPVWVEIDIVKDVTLNMETGEAEASSRASTFKEFFGALKDTNIEFDVLYDAADAQFIVLRTKFFDGTSIDIVAFDGAAATGAQGLRMTAFVAGFTRNEPLEETVTVNITMKPTPNSDSPPEWFTHP